MHVRKTRSETDCGWNLHQVRATHRVPLVLPLAFSGPITAADFQELISLSSIDHKFINNLTSLLVPKLD